MPSSKIELDVEKIEMMYHSKGMTIQEIADEENTSYNTVRRRMKENNIDRQSAASYKQIDLDYELLYRLYWDDYMTMDEIANELDVGIKTVFNNFQRLDIPTRNSGQKENKYPKYHCYEHNNNVYEFVVADSNYVPIHRLVAISEYGFENVSDMHIHHKNGIGWDNRPSNLEVLSEKEHAKHHSDGRKRNDDGTWV